jgi:SHS2 domain-containing protein
LRWEHFAHGADLGIRGIGSTPDEAFAAAALALNAAVTPPEGIALLDTVELECPGGDLPLLFFDFLNRVIYVMAVERRVFGACEVTLSPAGLRARLRGERIDPARHAPAVEPKGATFTALEVAPTASGEWRAQCVVDV